jgi:hypothetical protein
MAAAAADAERINEKLCKQEFVFLVRSFANTARMYKKDSVTSPFLI